jgi:hypothetical protein
LRNAEVGLRSDFYGLNHIRHKSSIPISGAQDLRHLGNPIKASEGDEPDIFGYLMSCPDGHGGKYKISVLTTSARRVLCERPCGDRNITPATLGYFSAHTVQDLSFVVR